MFQRKSRKVWFGVQGLLALFGIMATVADLGGASFLDWFDWNQLFDGLSLIVGSIRVPYVTVFFVLLIGALAGIQFFLERRNGPGRKVPPLRKDPPPFQNLRTGAVEERVGRDDALRWLRERLIDGSDPTVAVASVQGAGGMGKTFLTHVFAAEHREHTRFVEIHMGEDKSAAEAGRELLNTMGINTSLLDFDAKVGQQLQSYYESAQTGGILVLDDVTDQDVGLLLPRTPKWRVLITTRDGNVATRYAPGRIYHLDAFTPEESLLLMINILGDTFNEKLEADYVNLAAHLGHRPYGIRLAAESLRGSPTLQTPREFLEELVRDGLPRRATDEGEQHRLPSLRPLLINSLARLHKTSSFARSLLNELAMCSDEGMEIEFFLEWQSGKATADQVKQEAARAQQQGLLLAEERKQDDSDADKPVRIFRLHTDLLHVLREEKQEASWQSLFDFLEKKLVQDEGGMPGKVGLQKHIVALMETAPELEKLTAVVIQFFWHLFQTGQYQWAFDVIKAEEKIADLPKSRLCANYGAQALILREWGRLQEAIAFHKREESIAHELGHKAGLAASYGNQALILQIWGRLDEAMSLHKQEEQIKEELGDRAGLANSYGNQALILKAWNRLDEALALHKQAERIQKELGDRAGLAISYGNQALILKAWDRQDEALSLHKQEEQIYKEVGNRAGLAASYGNQAVILHAWDRLDEALSLHKQEEQICKEVGSRSGLINCHWNMGVLYRNKEQHDAALKYLRSAIELEKQLSHPDLEQDQRYLAAYLEELGEPPDVDG